jgi:voltage-gated potassium channel
VLSSPSPANPPSGPSSAAAGRAAWRERLYRIIFEHDTIGGRLFDVVLIVAILASVLVVMLDSVQQLRLRWGPMFLAAEWTFTLIFTAEYALRLLSAREPARYARSFLGLLDLFAVLPTYASLLFPAGRYLIVIRVLRVLRVFRVLKLATYMGEAAVLTRALRLAQRKIVIFVFTVLTILVVVGSLLYLVEGPASGFTSIPRGVYWAIVTLTTVGYGDIAPQTPLGQALAAVIMIMGYGIIAVPTGIVTVEMANAARMADLMPTTDSAPNPSLARAQPATPERVSFARSPLPPPPSAPERPCTVCGRAAHADDALFCARCGNPLEPRS